MLIFSSLNIKLDLFLLINWLDISGSVSFTSWSFNLFDSIVFSDDGLSFNWIQIVNLIFLRNEVDFMFSVNEFSLQNWLVVNFSVWSLISLGDNSFVVLDWSLVVSLVYYLVLSFLYVQNFSLEIVNWLNESLSLDLISWDWNFNVSNNGIVFDLSIFNLLFGVNWSLSLSFSDDWSLNDLLFDDWLRVDFLGQNWLLDDFSGSLSGSLNVSGLLDLWS